MSREILFKAKRKNWRELPKEEWWVYGEAIEIKGKMYIAVKYVDSEQITDFEMAQYIIQKTFVEIDPETLCQYTGLNDNTKWEQLSDEEKKKFLSEWNYKVRRMNREEDWEGRWIWENDIISINTYDYMEPSEDFFGKVVYCEAWACWCIQQPDNEEPIPLCECEGSYQTDRFVEGNIFDNLELLKEE